MYKPESFSIHSKNSLSLSGPWDQEFALAIVSVCESQAMWISQLGSRMPGFRITYINPMASIIFFLFSSVQFLSCVGLFSIPWTAAHQAALSITNSWSLLKLKSIKSVMSSNHLILCHPLLLLPSIFPSNRVFSNELALYIRWPKYWSFNFSFRISPSSENLGLI